MDITCNFTPMSCLQNGPLQVTNELSIVQNNFSWNHLADAIWVDQPGIVVFPHCYL